jgi:hypothetical protein
VPLRLAEAPVVAVKAAVEALLALPRADAASQELAGGGVQTPMSAAIRRAYGLLVQHEVRRLLPTVPRLSFRLVKSLVSRDGVGDQPLHFDTGVWDDDKWVDFSALLYLSPCRTAHLPRFPHVYSQHLYPTDAQHAAAPGLSSVCLVLFFPMLNLIFRFLPM